MKNNLRLMLLIFVTVSLALLVSFPLQTVAAQAANPRRAETSLFARIINGGAPLNIVKEEAFGNGTLVSTLGGQELELFNSILKADEASAIKLIEAGSPLNTKFNVNGVSGITLLLLAADLEESNIVKLLLSRHANLNAQISGELLKGTAFLGAAPIHIAARIGSLEIVQLLLGGGADVNSRTVGGRFAGSTPLVQAAVQGQMEVVRLLLSKGADVNAKLSGDGAGISVLQLAIDSGAEDVVKLLVGAHADVKARRTTADGYQGWTPLHSAASLGRVSIIKLLLSSGADVNASLTYGEGRGTTPLHSAVFAGNFDAVKELVTAGARINATMLGGNYAGATPLDLAVRANQQQISNYLTGAGGKRGVASEKRP